MGKKSEKNSPVLIAVPSGSLLDSFQLRAARRQPPAAYSRVQPRTATGTASAAPGRSCPNEPGPTRGSGRRADGLPRRTTARGSPAPTSSRRTSALTRIEARRPRRPPCRTPLSRPSPVAGGKMAAALLARVGRGTSRESSRRQRGARRCRFESGGGLLGRAKRRSSRPLPCGPCGPASLCPAGDGCVAGLLRQTALPGPHAREGGEAAGAGAARGGRG